MRIVGGEWRGRAIRAPKSRLTRPTTDRVREAIFDALSSRLGDFDGLRVLDAFAGSGAMGLEAMSRGADRVTFVEKDVRTARIIKENLSSLGASDRATVVVSDVFALAGRIGGGPFTLILLDPPYTLDASRVSQMLGQLCATGDIGSGAWIAWEHGAGTPAIWPEEFVPDAVKRYGNTEIEYAVFEGGST